MNRKHSAQVRTNLTRPEIVSEQVTLPILIWIVALVRYVLKL